MRNLSLIVLAFLFLGSLTRGGEIANQFQKQESAGETPKPADKSGVTEIGFERTHCFGTCPVYTLIIKPDGTFRYHGEDFVDRKGDFTGTIGKEQFDKIAKLVIKGDFMNLKSKYSRPITDHPTLYTMAVVDGNRKVISDYARGGPEPLLAVEDAIMEAFAKATWDEKK